MEKNTSKSTGKYSHLNSNEREEIAISLEMGLKQYEIALKLGHCPSTIFKEINRNRYTIGERQYRAGVLKSCLMPPEWKWERWDSMEDNNKP